jgi:hypothetical protein
MYQRTGGNYVIRSFIICTLKLVRLKVFKSRQMRYRGHVACMRKMRNAHKILVDKSQGERLFGSGEDNIEWMLENQHWI